ncbi:vacuolar protein sorting-associated protein 25 [Senna tora]|uniref:ESCRT-II complex subunit VPS25 n=1 Tax=Senna tora TaxID=362788 RepID=A0A834WNH6_9FABA|nr:vacuolar protein sorting-associated protein 25 [Senna tora]
MAADEPNPVLATSGLQFPPSTSSVLKVMEPKDGRLPGLTQKLSTEEIPNRGFKPVRDTREKQIQLWKDLIIDYCKTQKIFVIGLEEEFPLFSNPVIERSLSHEAREAFLSALVSEGRAEWMDKGHKKCLILWHRIQDWADIIVQFAKDNGLEDGVVTLEEIRSGTESQGTELQGIDRIILNRALKLLEQKGKLAIFKGTSTDDEVYRAFGKIWMGFGARFPCSSSLALSYFGFGFVIFPFFFFTACSIYLREGASNSASNKNSDMDWKPKLGMEFDSLEKAWTFWNDYGGKMGFGVRKAYTNKSKKDGSVTSVRFLCSKEGLRRVDKRDHLTKNPRQETRTDCKVRMGLTNENGIFRVSDLIEDHNHVLQTPKTAYMLPSQRNISEVQAHEIELAEDSGLQQRASYELFSRHVGGRDHLGFTRLDQKNYLRTRRQKSLKYGEAGCLLRYFQEQTLIDPSFYRAFQMDNEEQITNIFWADARMRLDYGI